MMICKDAYNQLRVQNTSKLQNLKNGMIPEFEREALAGPGRKSSMKKTASEIPFLESGTNGSDEQ